MKRARLTAALVACLLLGSIGGAANASADFGIKGFSSTFHDPAGPPVLAAGGHPDASTDLEFNLDSGQQMIGTVRDVEVDLPAGFYGNPEVLARCSFQDLIKGEGYCDPDAQVGVLHYEAPKGSATDYPVYILDSTDEQTAVLGVVPLAVPSKIVISARTDGDFGLTARLVSINEGLNLMHTTLTLWGVPAADVHDPLRFCGQGCSGASANVPERPFVTLPARCEPVVTKVRVDSWQDPGVWHTDFDESPPLTGCEDLDFSPSLAARPTTDVADSPSGLESTLTVPQNVDDPDEPSSAMLRTAEVTLPEGLVINPSAANGLGSCDLDQVGFAGLGSEQQLIKFPAPLTKDVAVTFDGQTTTPISAEADPATVTAELETLPGLAGNVEVERVPSGWLVTFVGALAGKDVAGTLGAVARDNLAQSVEVTGETGSFNLHVGTRGTETEFEADLTAGSGGMGILKSSRTLVVGEAIEGPGILPGTRIVFTLSFPTVFISANATETIPAAQLKTAMYIDAPAQEIQEAIQRIPAAGKGNVIVVPTGTSGSTRSFDLVYAGELSGTELPMTATSSLTGPGAGVTITPKPTAPPHALDVTVMTEAGTPHFDKSPADCPDASRIGTAEVDTQVFADPLEGAVYTMTPHDNPFGSLLGVYVVIEGKGLVIKQAGKVEADPKTGRLRAVFDDVPQLPFEDFKLKFDGGPLGILRTPATCGSYATVSELTPWSAPETPSVSYKDTYSISKSPAGSCASSESQLPSKPSFDAGSQNAIAGAYAPFVLNLSRNDGTRPLSGIDTTLPKGVIAKLAGTTYCSEGALAAAAQKNGKAEQASPSCPGSSRVGSLTVGSGAGPRPFYAPGVAYLAGPYKGAPLSLAVIVPAVAGPFDLGTVVVRNALYVDPVTAQVHAVSDPFPTILEGIPLDVRSVALRLDRSEFTKNPTSCDPFQVSGLALAPSGGSAAIESRFQVAECGRLGFKPKLAISLKGKTKRTGNPALNAVLRMPAGSQANIAKTTVVLPKTMFIDNAHISNPCTRVQFDAGNCPANSILGQATAFSPLLDEPLSGPVYFRSNGGERELPDLVADLNGQIHVTLVGFIDSVKAGPEGSRIRTRFLSVPDAPVSKFVLKMAGGKKGLIENSVNLCSRRQVASVSMEAHNAKTYTKALKLGVQCGGGKKRKR